MDEHGSEPIGGAAQPSRVGGHNQAVPGGVDWAIASVERVDWRRDHPGLAAAYSASPELVERVRSLWPADLAISCGGCMELMVLAHRGGFLFSDDPGKLLGRLDPLCRLAGDTPPLASESAEDRAAIEGRLALLRRSARQRREYVEVLSAVWAAIGPLWEREGRPQVERAVAARRRQIEDGRPWTEVTSGPLPAYRDELDAIVRGMGPGAEVVVVPAYYAHLGLIFALPDLLVVGVRAAPSDPRVGLEPVANRLKAVAEPTRLAILSQLARSPSTVTELARQFGVAQPTISNHIKLLRDAGLVTSGAGGGRRELVADQRNIRQLMAELGTALALVPAQAG